MNKPKKPRRNAHPSTVLQPTTIHSSSVWKSLISLWLALHFFGLLLALAANLAPSALQRVLLDAIGPYLTVVGQSYGIVPLEMIQGVQMELPFVFEVHRQGDASQSWQPVLPDDAPDAMSTSHAWKQFSRLSAIVTLEQQDAVVTGLCEAVIRSYARRETSPVDGVRIVRNFAPSFEQAALIASGQGELIHSEMSDEVLYQARIVNFPDGRVAFVPESTSTRAARSVNSDSGAQPKDSRSTP